MAVKKAAEPTRSLAELIDQHLQLEANIKSLIDQKKALTDEIISIMEAKHLRSAMGNKGEGYRRASWLQCDFEPGALEYVRRIKKEHLFVPEPSITKARLRDAFSAGHLSAVQVDKVQKFAGPDYRVHRLYKISKEEGSADV